MAQHSEEFLKLAAEAKENIRQVPPKEALRLIKAGATLLDVREKDEFEKSHLDGAIHLSRGVLEMNIGQVVPEKSAPSSAIAVAATVARWRPRRSKGWDTGTLFQSRAE